MQILNDQEVEEAVFSLTSKLSLSKQTRPCTILNDRRFCTHERYIIQLENAKTSLKLKDTLGLQKTHSYILFVCNLMISFTCHGKI